MERRGTVMTLFKSTQSGRPGHSKRRSVPLLPLLLCAGAASAHHGLANFNLNVDLTIEGTISDIALINPHSWIYVDVTNADGTVSNWKCELRGGTVLRRSGWTKEMFEIGSAVTITGSPDRFEENTCYMGSILFANGNKMDRYGQLVEAELDVRRPIEVKRLANGVPDISGDWAAEQVVMTDPRGLSGTLVPLSVADEFAPGEVPEGRSELAGILLRRSARDDVEAPAADAAYRCRPCRRRRFRRRLHRQPAPELRVHEHPVRLELR
jgi:hypothetical protein